jgi:hypothetical protein
MPPYHTVSGNALTVYLDLAAAADCGLGNATDNVLAQLAADWGPIATANGLTLTFALSASTPPPMLPVPGAIGVAPGAAPPAGVSYFHFLVGRGTGAMPGTQSARISYVSFAAGTGYLYERPTELPTRVRDVSHELGHVLGLADRYYDAVYWLKNRAIDRTCTQIRKGLFDPPETRDGIADPGPQLSDQPRLAVRATLPMSAAVLPGDAAYDPYQNLMSSGAPALTPGQVDLIRNQTAEPSYRVTSWVAVLGDWERRAAAPAPTTVPTGARGAGLDFPTAGSNFNDVSKWIYPAWEAGPQEGGTGLLFLPPGGVIPHRYGCLAGSRRGRAADGSVVMATRLAAAMGRTRVYAFAGSTYNVIGMNTVHPSWMCHVRRTLHDLA